MTKPLIGLTGTRQTRQSTLPGLPLQGVFLSDDYALGIERVDGIPVVIPYLTDEVALGELAKRLDGLVLSGGEDVDPPFTARTLITAWARSSRSATRWKLRSFK